MALGLFNLGYLVGLIGFYVLIGYGIYKLVKNLIKKVKKEKVRE